MRFSQAWDAGFRALMIYIGTVFVWLGLVEEHIGSRSVSIAVMNVVAVVLAAGFFLRAWARAVAERAQAEADVRAMLEEAV